VRIRVGRRVESCIAHSPSAGHSGSVLVQSADHIPEVSWIDDYKQRTNPALFTELLRQAVRALGAVQWQVLETADGYARSVLPLVGPSTNHQGTPATGVAS
jgi:hypothetical protein